jgi:hypothetical protein
MTFVGPGAIQWMPAVQRRAAGDTGAAFMGFALGVVAFGMIVWQSPKRPILPALPPRPQPQVRWVLRPIEPAPPVQTLAAPYSDAAAQGNLTLPPQLAAGQVGVMLLGYAKRPARDPEDE